MQGLMMKHELMISDLIEHASTVHGTREIYTLNTDLSEHRYTWADCAVRVRKLANALKSAGIKKGDRVATIAWNNYLYLMLHLRNDRQSERRTLLSPFDYSPCDGRKYE